MLGDFEQGCQPSGCASVPACQRLAHATLNCLGYTMKPDKNFGAGMVAGIVTALALQAGLSLDLADGAAERRTALNAVKEAFAADLRARSLSMSLRRRTSKRSGMQPFMPRKRRGVQSRCTKPHFKYLKYPRRRWMPTERRSCGRSGASGLIMTTESVQKRLRTPSGPKFFDCCATPNLAFWEPLRTQLGLPDDTRRDRRASGWSCSPIGR